VSTRGDHTSTFSVLSRSLFPPDALKFALRRWEKTTLRTYWLRAEPELRIGG
jgi:hypothetical protein